MASRKIAWLGDSITWGGPARTTIPPPMRLQMLIEAGHPREGHIVANFGVSGATTNDNKTSWTNQIRSKGYDTLVFLSGVNDCLQDISAATAWSNQDSVITQALADGMTVVLITTLPWGNTASWTSGRQTLTDTLLVSQRARSGVVLLDAYPGFETAAGSKLLKASYDVGDGLHLNLTGSDALAAAVYALLVFQ